MLIYIVIFAIFIIVPTLTFIASKEIDKQNDKKERNYKELKQKELTEEQIADIHARGKITPTEKVKEWEGLGICAPGDYVGSAAWRGHKFKNCHDCLVDYANTQDEYTSFYDEIKIVCK